MQRIALAWTALVALILATPVSAQTKAAVISDVGSASVAKRVDMKFEFTEGPTIDADGTLYFSDIPNNVIYKRDPQGEITPFLTDTKGCNGLLLDGEGHLLACQGGAGKVIAIDLKTKAIEVLAEEANGEKLKKPNDLTRDKDGGIYFTDWDGNAVYYIAPDRKVSQLVKDWPNANGIQLSNDGKTLYLLSTKRPEVMAYPVEAPGKLGEAKELCKLKQVEDPEKKRGGDGMTIDAKGNLFVTQPNLKAIQVLSPQGKTLGFIPIPEMPANCTLSKDGKTLFVTARTSVYQVTLTPVEKAGFNSYPLILLGIGILFIFFMILVLKVNAFLALIGAALVIGLLSPRVLLGDGVTFDFVNAPVLVSQAFGSTMGKIGLAIAFATIIGKAMMESGAADRVVRFFTNLFGDRFAPVALLASGYLLSVPVFFDTVFLLLIPLAKALRMRTGKDYLLYVTAIGAGGAVTHGLVPPTPGPIVMSETLRVDLGVTILVGFFVGIPVAASGFLYAKWINARLPVPLREAGSVSLEELQQRSQMEDKHLPALWVSLLPILLPVLFITSGTAYRAVAKNMPNLQFHVDGAPTAELDKSKLPAEVRERFADSKEEALSSEAKVSVEEKGKSWKVSDGERQYLLRLDNARLGVYSPYVAEKDTILEFLSNSAIALLLSAIVSLIIVVRQKRMTRSETGKFTAVALDDAGMILLITSAGGAFGAMLQSVGVGDTLGSLADMGDIDLLFLAWGLAALFKVAQGSGTVSMITSSAIMLGILTSRLGVGADEITGEMMGKYLGYHPVYLVMAIGVGSKVGSWMNDSGFWVVCKMGGLTEGETFKSWTITLIVMGIVGLPIVWILTRVLPLVSVP